MSAAALPSRVSASMTLALTTTVIALGSRRPLLDPVGSHSPSSIPVLMFSKYICANCVHGIHTHDDYVSMVVSHYPPTRCTAYVQKVCYSPFHPHLELKLPALQTPLTQRCTCEAQLCDHIAIDNPYRVAGAMNVLDYLPDSSVPSSNDTMNNSFTANSVPFSSNTANGSLMPVTRCPIYSNHMGSHSLSPSSFHSILPFNPILRPITPCPVSKGRISLRPKLIAPTIPSSNIGSMTTPTFVSQAAMRRLEVMNIRMRCTKRYLRHPRTRTLST